MLTPRTNRSRRTHVSLVPHATTGNHGTIARFTRATVLVLDLQQRRRAQCEQENATGERNPK